MRRLLLLGGLSALVLACADMDPTDVLDPGDPSGLISDSNQQGGNKAFFWLAPIVKNSSYSGVFNPNLKPKVVICELAGQECATVGGAPVVVAAFTMESGPGGELITLQNEQFRVNWHVGDFEEVVAGQTYRIQVFLTEEEELLLGVADVEIGANGGALRDVNTDEYIPLVDNRTLPIAFRIEKGAVCGDPDDTTADCGEAVVGPEGGVVTTLSGFAGVEIPAGAVEGDILIKIRRVDPEMQPWGECLPTGLRQEEGCYEFDTEPAISEVNAGRDTFNVGVVVGVCPAAPPEDRLSLHKYDPDNPSDGIEELPGVAETFLTCEGFAVGESNGLFGRLAAAARGLLRPIAGLVGGTPLYARDAGRGGIADAFSYIGWAEPVEISLATADLPSFALAGDVLNPEFIVRTTHNHGADAEEPIDAPGATLRFEYSVEGSVVEVLTSSGEDGTPSRTPTWTLTTQPGTHVLSVSTRREIVVDAATGEKEVIPDSTNVITLTLEVLAAPDSCDGETDCASTVIGPQGDTLVTPTGFAGVVIPEGALDGPLVVTVKRIDPESQQWGRCLPTGLRQEEGCYLFDTDPAIGEVNEEDRFNQGHEAVVAICLDPEALRPERLTLHKYDPDHSEQGVVELEGADETFLDCANYMSDPGSTGSLSSAARRLLAPVASLLVPQPLYARDAGRGGIADAFSYIGWAEPVTLALRQGTGPEGEAQAVVEAWTAHNHDEQGAPIQSVPADGATVRFEHTDPNGVTTTPNAMINANGEARLSLDQAGEHSVRVSTQIFQTPDETPVPDPLEVTVLGQVSLWNADGADLGTDAIGPNHGSLVGTAVTRATGLLGEGFLFEGGSGTVTAGTANFGDAAEWTLSAWVKLDAAGDPLAIQRFVTMSGQQLAKGVLRQEQGNPGDARKLHFYGEFGGSLQHVWQPQGLVAGCWHHVVGVHSSTQNTLYLDGQVSSSVAATGEGVVAEGITFSSSDEPLAGVLDEVAVHNYALTAAEVSSAYASAGPPECTVGAISGQLTDQSGVALNGHNVSVEGTNISTFTDGKAWYHLEPVPTGQQTITVTVEGFAPYSMSVGVSPGEVLPHDIVLTPLADGAN